MRETFSLWSNFAAPEIGRGVYPRLFLMVKRFQSTPAAIKQMSVEGLARPLPPP